MPLPMLLQTCRYNFHDKVEVRMGAVKAHTWKEFVEQAEITEKSAKKFESFTPKNANNKGRDTAQSSQAKVRNICCGSIRGNSAEAKKE